MTKITEAKPQYIENSVSDDIITYIKSNGEESIFIAVNMRDREISATVDKAYEGTELLSYGAVISGKEIKLSAFGYTVIKINN